MMRISKCCCAQTQGILSEEEFDQFYNALKTPLPTTFRITGSREWVALRHDPRMFPHTDLYTGLLWSFENSWWPATFRPCKTLKWKERPLSHPVHWNGTLRTPYPIIWRDRLNVHIGSYRYPDNLGWHFKVSRGVLRKSPAISAFHKFMVAETEIVRDFDMALLYRHCS